MTGKQGMTTFEYMCWKDFYSICPFGEKFQDYRAALSVKTLLAPYTKSEVPFNRFLLLPNEEEEQLSTEELTHKVQAFLGTRRKHLGAEV